MFSLIAFSREKSFSKIIVLIPFKDAQEVDKSHAVFHISQAFLDETLRQLFKQKSEMKQLFVGIKEN